MDAVPPSAPALGTASTAVSAKPRTLSDVAAERKLGKRPASGGTFSVTGASGMPVLLSPVYGEGGSFAAVDAADAAHRPTANAIQTVVGWPYVVTGYGYGWQTQHVAPHHGQRVAPPATSPHVGHSTRGAGKRHP